MASQLRDYSEDDYKYDTSQKHRGKALIFTFGKFRNPSLPELPYNKYKDTEYSHMHKSLMKAGFQVKRHKDQRRSQVMDILTEAAKDPFHKNADMFMCIFLTHGDGYQGLVYASDQAISLDEIQEKFMEDKCLNLRSKPKYFIFQASHYQESIGTDGGEEDQDELVSQTVPADANFLLYWYTMPGSTYFWKGQENLGPMFSRALATELETMVTESQTKEEKEDFKMLFYRTIFLMNQQLREYYPQKWQDDHKILPVVEDSLTKFYLFAPKPAA